MPTTLIPLRRISLVRAGAHPTLSVALWDTAPAPTREIHQRGINVVSSRVDWPGHIPHKFINVRIRLILSSPRDIPHIPHNLKSSMPPIILKHPCDVVAATRMLQKKSGSNSTHYSQ